MKRERQPSAFGRLETGAHLLQSGTVTRPMGRFDERSIADERAVRGVVAMRPMASRTPVPELPKSRGSWGS